MPICNSCGEDRSRQQFSKSQLKKVANERRCYNCVLPSTPEETGNDNKQETPRQETDRIMDVMMELVLHYSGKDMFAYSEEPVPGRADATQVASTSIEEMARGGFSSKGKGFLVMHFMTSGECESLARALSLHLQGLRRKPPMMPETMFKYIPWPYPNNPLSPIAEVISDMMGRNPGQQHAFDGMDTAKQFAFVLQIPCGRTWHDGGAGTQFLLTEYGGESFRQGRTFETLCPKAFAASVPYNLPRRLESDPGFQNCRHFFRMLSGGRPGILWFRNIFDAWIDVYKEEELKKVSPDNLLQAIHKPYDGNGPPPLVYATLDQREQFRNSFLGRNWSSLTSEYSLEINDPNIVLGILIFLHSDDEDIDACAFRIKMQEDCATRGPVLITTFRSVDP